MSHNSLLEHFQVQDMRLGISQKDAKLRLYALDNRELDVKSVREVCVVEYWPLLVGDHPPTDELWAALKEGDPVKTRQAIEAGAHLNYLPVTSASPIALSILNRKGNWQECVRALVEAGAPLNGIPGQEPTIYRTVWQIVPWIGDDPSAIPAIELLLELGADINARCHLKHHHIWTALHRAVSNCNPLLVKYLVSRGADTELVDDKGRTALSMARDNAKNCHGQAQPASEEIVRFLSDPQANLER
ncbi:MAG: ankyrin repeat domain-containing protein [Planctomycetes bacterium]|nr:ankyrin repeat domain-containing protein [Planctomycetota bacterium]